MIPLTFGPADRSLFGVYHPAQTATAEPRGVLLCNPWGQEAIRAHRLLRVLADRLARSGLHVLRFDYFGTGDSAGADEDGDLCTWAQNILQAHQTLQIQSSALAISWIGVRLGALLALQAASLLEQQSQPEQLLLWDPVLNGARYLELLSTKHAEALQEVYSLPSFLFKQDPRQIPPGPVREALGFGIGPALLEQLNAADFTSTPQAPQSPTHIVTNDEALSLKNTEPANASFSIQHLSHNFDWTAEEAMNTALVPANAIAHLVSHVMGSQQPKPRDLCT
jgi:uncharacterized protein